MQNNYQIYQGDCLKLMKDIEDKRLIIAPEFQRGDEETGVWSKKNKQSHK